MTCPICIAPYNKTVNFRVVCPDTTCGYEACKECVRTYLLGATQDPHCMNCRKAFDPEFITTNLNVSWMKSTYRDHRKKLLVEREISRIPDTMQFVENQRQIRTLTKDEEDCKKTIKDMQFNLNQMQNHKYTIQRDINTLKRGGNLVKIELHIFNGFFAVFFILCKCSDLSLIFYKLHCVWNSTYFTFNQ